MERETENTLPKNIPDLIDNATNGFSTSLIDLLPCTFAIYSMEGKFLLWNEKFATVTGYTDKEIESLNALAFFEESYRLQISNKIHEAFTQGSAEIEAALLTKSGLGIPYFLTAKAIKYQGQVCLTAIGIDISERKAAEFKLSEGEMRYTSAIQGIGAGVWDITDFEAQLYELSPKYLELIGRKHEGRKYSLSEIEKWIEPEDYIRMTADFNGAVYNSQTNYSTEARYILPDGSLRWFLFSGYITYTNGIPVRATGSIIDIHETKIAQQQLKERKEQMKLFIEHSPVALAMFDTDMCYLAVSKRWMADFKLTGQNIIGKNHYEVFPDVTDEWKAINDRCLQGAVEKRDEDIFPRADGTIDWLRWEVQPWHKATGEIGGIIIFSEIITEQKEAEIKFRSLVEKSLVGVYILQEGLFTYVNPRFAEIFGYLPDEMIGMSPVDLLIAEEDKTLLSEYQKARANGDTDSVHYEAIGKRKDGTEIWLEAYGSLAQYQGRPAVLGTLIDITERRKSAAALQASLKELSDYKIALDESSIVAITDQKGIINYVNDNFCTISKYSREELIGQDHRIVNSGYHSKEFIRNLWVTIANGNIWRGDLCNRAKDGSFYWVETTIVPFLNDKGKPWQYVAIRSDITERNKSAAALRDSIKELNDYKIALDESSIVAITNQKGIINYVNDNFCNISKYSREELIGQDHRIINSGYHSKEFIRDLWVTIANGNIWKGDLCNRAKDGTIYWVETTIVPFLNDNGKPWQYVAIRSDITSRKLAEEAIRISEQTRRLIMDSAIDAIVCIDTTGKIILWTPQAEKIFGWKENEILGKTLTQTIIPHQYREAHTKGFARYLATQKTEMLNTLIEITALDKHEKEFPVELSITPIENGSNIFFCAFIRDITDRKADELHREKMTSDIVQRNKDLEQFAYIVSHNLRAPVANIIGFAQELNNKNNTEEEAKLFSTYLTASASKLDDVIKDLNYILQIRRGVDEQRETVSFSKMVKDITDSIKYMVDNTEVTISTHFDEVDSIQITGSYLYSILYNLITNSIKYRRPDVPPHIEISTKKNQDTVTLIFKDNGMGIDLESKGGQVFGLYKRFHTNVAEGKGMGLYMVKTQVETIGGKIGITSKVNKGTTFTIQLPL